MPIDVDTSLAPQVVIFRIYDEWPVVDAQRSIRKQLTSEGHLTPMTRVLVDLRNAKIPSDGDAAAAISAAVDDGALPPMRAYLVGSALQFGFSKQLETLSPPHSIVEIFTTERDAFMWLHR